MRFQSKGHIILPYQIGGTLQLDLHTTNKKRAHTDSMVALGMSTHTAYSM
jgi:hypothetical protein